MNLIEASPRQRQHGLLLVAVGQLQRCLHALQQLIVEGVGAVELQDNVRGEDVLDAADVVLSLGF